MPASLIGVYRARNAHLAWALSEPAITGGWRVAWWALDDVVEELAPFTVGSGPGTKLLLLNRILHRLGDRTSWLVVTDDDLIFERGDVIRLRALCETAGFDLAQPARSDSPVSHEITAARELSVARRTSFVEIGPLFVVGPRWRDRIVPFPEDRGMGWGMEFEWFELAREGCRLGIVDSVPARHTGAVGEGYDVEQERARVAEELVARGYESISQIQETIETWRPWERLPEWAGSADAASPRS